MCQVQQISTLFPIFLRRTRRQLRFWGILFQLNLNTINRSYTFMYLIGKSCCHLCMRESYLDQGRFSSKIEWKTLSVFKYFKVNSLRFRHIIARKKGFRFDTIEADMNMALEFINSPSSVAGPDRWLEQKPSTRSVSIYNHSAESSPEMSNWHAQLKRNTSCSVFIFQSKKMSGNNF